VLRNRYCAAVRAGAREPRVHLRIELDAGRNIIKNQGEDEVCAGICRYVSMEKEPTLGAIWEKKSAMH
jgi:hypothetical protein